MESRKANLEHITKLDKRSVYPPSVDTYLLADSIVNDIQFIRSLNPAIILEVGVGCGAVLASVGINLGEAYYLGVDINPKSAELAKTTLEINNVQISEFIAIDIFKGMNLSNKVDVIVCNPPYVATSAEEYQECQARMDISSSFSGGVDGREFIDKLLELASDYLSEKGVMYMICEIHNGYIDGTKVSEERKGCEGVMVLKRTKFSEIRRIN
ncbi:unnamed protein product [Blepharisma stoltei]|uniref:Methyltransferase small domain-containing protein n=1 Tax=Blepharisma stoltei TaxID=1481888 RepID=A0AAU9JIW8_9CILI|nr:unnamed protein product [Blepharisma stoltei]